MARDATRDGAAATNVAARDGAAATAVATRDGAAATAVATRDGAAATAVATAAIQRAWRARCSRAHARLAATLRQLAVCAVCHDECVQVIRCRNGHACCEGCELSSADTRCPMCRVPRAYARDVTLERVLRAADPALRCTACGAAVRPRECERHRAWCPAHRFVCPAPGCTATVGARDMAAHVARHVAAGEAHALRRRADGTYGLVVGVTRAAGETFVLALDGARGRGGERGDERGDGDDRGAVVVVTVVPQRTRVNLLPAHQHDWPLLHVQLYAFYPGPTAPAIVATVRQLRAADCDAPGGFLEEHRSGAVAPMLASRENVLLGVGGPLIAARSILHHDAAAAPASDRPLVRPDAAPSPELGRAVRAHGVRDPPLDRTSLPADPGAQCAILQIGLRLDAAVAVEAAYPIGGA